MPQIFVRCPMDGSDHQQYCGLVEHYKSNGIADQCPHQSECNEIKTYLLNDEGKLNEIK
jgi:hypothetical protein